MEVPPATLQSYAASKMSCDLLGSSDPVLILPYDIFNIRIFFSSGSNCGSKDGRVCLSPL